MKNNETLSQPRISVIGVTVVAVVLWVGITGSVVMLGRQNLEDLRQSRSNRPMLMRMTLDPSRENIVAQWAEHGRRGVVQYIADYDIDVSNEVDVNASERRWFHLIGPEPCSTGLPAWR